MLTRVSQGDEAAFTHLVAANKIKLTAFARNMTQSSELAEEVVQDVFLKIWITREWLPDIQNLQAYLFVIARNLCINAMRRSIRQKLQLKEWQQQHVDTGDEHDNLLLDLLEEAVMQLPGQQQQAWRLSRKQGLRYEEIATVMGLSKQTVKRHISLANAGIKAYLQNHPDLLLWIMLYCWHK